MDLGTHGSYLLEPQCSLTSKFKIKVPAGLISPEASIFGLQMAASSRGLLSFCVMRCWFKDASFMTSLNLHYVVKGPVSQFSHVGGYTSACECWGRLTFCHSSIEEKHESRHPCFVPHVKKNALGFFPIKYGVYCGCFAEVPNEVREFTFFPRLLSVFLFFPGANVDFH